MTHRIPIEELMQLSRQMVVLDVRSPAEFAHGHIPWPVVSLYSLTTKERW